MRRPRSLHSLQLSHIIHVAKWSISMFMSDVNSWKPELGIFMATGSTLDGSSSISVHYQSMYEPIKEKHNLE